jgi:chromosome partitioning protein
MKTLVIANQKGGVGKTSILVHLAFDFFERDLKTVVIDLDSQGNASHTLQKFKSGLTASQLFAIEPIDCKKSICTKNTITLIESDTGLANIDKLDIASANRNFQKAIGTIEEQGYDVCLIDTAPSLGVAMVVALIASNYVLSPIELETYSIQGIKRMVTTIANIRSINNKLEFLGMVPSKVDARNPRHGRHLKELTGVYPQLIVPEQIGLRSSIADALSSGVPVWKIKKTSARKAVQEFRALALYIFNKMEIPNVR